MAELHRLPTVPQRGGDERRASRDEPEGSVTRGGPLGISGAEWRALRTGWLFGMGIVGVIITINIVTRALGQGEPFGKAAVEEGSSALSLAIAIAMPAAMALWIRRRRPGPGPMFLVCAAGFLVFVLMHVGGFVALRAFAEPAFLGRSYSFAPVVPQTLYEATKDVFSYTLTVASFWLILGWLASPTPEVQASPSTFDIRDGARLVRIELGDILAVRSAGNYVEFLLADGRRPLMRSPLSLLESQLGPAGFLRTHRSWLVNGARVTGLRPEGSGDYAVELGPEEAPLSRRYRPALEKLRG